MQYVIMANGQAKRWKNHLGIPKHLVKVGGETLLARTTRLLHEADADAQVVITAHDERYETMGARLHRPHNYELEIDRFPPELLDEPTVFLYGDTFYTQSAIEAICAPQPKRRLCFYGSTERIFAVRANDYELMRSLLEELRAEVVAGKIADCKGWQLYHRYLRLPLEGKEIAQDYVLLEDATTDFNTPEEYEAFAAGR